MLAVVSLQEYPQFRVEQIVAYCINIDSTVALPPKDIDELQVRTYGPLMSFVWTKSYNMFLSLGFVGFKIQGPSGRHWTNSIKEKIIRKLDRPLKRCEDNCDVFRESGIVNEVFESKRIGHEIGNFRLVWEWALQTFTYTIRGERHSCCRIIDLLFQPKRQEMDFNVFYPLWVPDEGGRKSYLEEVSQRLHQQLQDKITHIKEDRMYDNL
jgi:hypothetical protein